MSVKKLAILFSGNGSNLENLLDKFHMKSFWEFATEVKLVICNNPLAKGIEKAHKFGLSPVIIDHKDYTSRAEFEEQMLRHLRRMNVDLVVLAGFMRILSPVFTNEIKAINLHPSLLPLFKGANAIKESYYSDEKQGGVSVHWVNEELDSGEIIAQSAFDKEGMSFEEFEQKIHDIEYEILPEAILQILKKD